VWVVLAAAPVHAQQGVPIAISGKSPVPSTQVLVLGTVHLASAPKDFQPASLEPLLQRLADFKPQIITVEQIPGEICDLMARQTAVYDPGDVATYCSDTRAAKAATGLDVIAAMAEVERALKQWPAAPVPAQRRHLAALFLAAGDGTSATVQWLQLPATERHAGDGLDDALVAELAEQPRNESRQIAARLAARLGLQRVYPIDDHTGDNVDVSDAAAYGKAIQRAWDSASAATAPLRKQEDVLWQRGDMLALYRYINQPDRLRASVAGDFGAALADTSAEHYGRIYVAAWETRNLRMVANVHAAFRETPGVRVLSLVGSQHKPWFDNLLGQMQGVQIVDVERVLK
jgi:hypothetical protein